MGPSETKKALAPGRETIPVGDKETLAPGRETIPVGDKYYAYAAAAASRFSPGGEAASGGHISFCEERNVGKKVA